MLMMMQEEAISAHLPCARILSISSMRASRQLGRWSRQRKSILSPVASNSALRWKQCLASLPSRSLACQCQTKPIYYLSALGPDKGYDCLQEVQHKNEEQTRSGERAVTDHPPAQSACPGAHAAAHLDTYMCNPLPSACQ